MRIALLTLLLVASAANGDPHWSSTANARCSYYNWRTDVRLADEPCMERWGVINGQVTGVYVMKRVTLTFVQKKSQDQWGTYVLRDERLHEDRPAVRYEENRDEFHYVTLDLREFLDVRY